MTERVDDMCIRFDTTPESDGQTDGSAITISRSACIGMLMRGKNAALRHTAVVLTHPYSTGRIVGLLTCVVLVHGQVQQCTDITYRHTAAMNATNTEERRTRHLSAVLSTGVSESVCAGSCHWKMRQ